MHWPTTGDVAVPSRLTRCRMCPTPGKSKTSSSVSRSIDTSIDCPSCSVRSCGCASSRRRAFAKWRRRSIAPKVRSSNCSCGRSRTSARAWVVMAERPLPDRLDETIGVILDRRDATAALRDDAVAPLARIALELRHYPDADFKARLRTLLRGRTTMTTAVETAVRTGFSTVTPYLRVPEEGLVDFLIRVFDAQETMSGRGGGGGMHREVRIGDSMVMIGEGGGGAVMPVRPMAFHVFVK